MVWEDVKPSDILTQESFDNAITADMALGAAGPAVDASNAAAHELGVNSTPTVAIDGRLLVGASYEEIAAAVVDATRD